MLPLSVTDGSALGSALDLGAADLGTIVFVSVSSDPANAPDGYE